MEKKLRCEAIISNALESVDYTESEIMGAPAGGLGIASDQIASGQRRVEQIMLNFLNNAIKLAGVAASYSRRRWSD